jgi:hypothetical protein
MIWPIIPGWIVHLYLKVPAAVNLWVNFPPLGIIELTNELSLAVTSWSKLSLLVQVTVVFTATVIDFGTNVVFCIQTSLGPGPDGVVLSDDFFVNPLSVKRKIDNIVTGLMLLNTSEIVSS